MRGVRPYSDVGVQVFDVELAGPRSGGGEGAHLGHRGALSLCSFPGQVLLCLQSKDTHTRQKLRRHSINCIGFHCPTTERRPRQKTPGMASIVQGPTVPLLGMACKAGGERLVQGEVRRTSELFTMMAWPMTIWPVNPIALTMSSCMTTTIDQGIAPYLSAVCVV